MTSCYTFFLQNCCVVEVRCSVHADKNNEISRKNELILSWLQKQRSNQLPVSAFLNSYQQEKMYCYLMGLTKGDKLEAYKIIAD